MSLGLFGTLGVAAGSLQTEQLGLEVTSQNLANVNNPAYSRQVLQIQSNPTIPSGIGPEGTGASGANIQQIRSSLLDSQIQAETSISSYWNTMQEQLQTVQADLGQQINTQATGVNGASTTSEGGIAQAISDFFNSLQTLSTDPSSTANQQAVVQSAQMLTSQLNQASQQMTTLKGDLNTSLQGNVTSANQLLSQIATLNGQIAATQNSESGSANDLIDSREQAIEQLAQLVNVTPSPGANGAVDISIGGTTLVQGPAVLDTLQTYDAGGGQLLVQTKTGGTDLTLTSGSIQGTIDARDDALATLSSNLDTLSAQLAGSVNAIYKKGYSVSGTTGNNLFEGDTAGTITVNSTLAGNPTLFQSSGTDGNAGDNQVALALAQLADQPISGLNSQTISQAYDQTVSTLAQSVASANTQVTDQQVVQNTLQQQRSSTSGVSLDEEMTNLTTYQRAYQASAELITVVDTMLNTLMTMKQTA